MSLIALTTLAKLHQERKWNFYEKGLNAMWREYDQLILAAIEGAGSAMPTGVTTLGDAGLVANFVPDVVPLLPLAGQMTKNGEQINPPTQF